MGIRESYRRLSKKVHPDVGGSDGLMQDLNEIYESAKQNERETSLAIAEPVKKSPNTSTPRRYQTRHLNDVDPSAGINDPGNLKAFAAYAQEHGLQDQVAFMLRVDDGTLDQFISDWLYNQ